MNKVDRKGQTRKSTVKEPKPPNGKLADAPPEIPTGRSTKNIAVSVERRDVLTLRHRLYTASTKLETATTRTPINLSNNAVSETAVYHPGR